MVWIWGVTRCQNCQILNSFLCSMGSSKCLLCNLPLVWLQSNKHMRSHIWFALWSWLQMRRCDVFLPFFYFRFCLLLFFFFFLLITYLFISMFWLNYYHNVQHHLLRWYKKLQSLQKNVQLCFIKIWKLTSVWQGFITVIINYAGVGNAHLIENAGCVLHAVYLVCCFSALSICLSILHPCSEIFFFRQLSNQSRRA